MLHPDFPRTLALLRQDKKISQRQAAQDLGVSQALLSHHENGAREPGLVFVTRACDYYEVSADYLLGRTLSRDGSMIRADELYDSSDERASLRGNIAATLQKKLLVNTINLLFELLGALGKREAISAAGNYIGATLYRLYRALFRRAGAKESFFSLRSGDFSAGAVDATMHLSMVAYEQALDEHREEQGDFPSLDGAALAEKYGALAQSLTQVLHATEEQTNHLLERK